MKIKSKMYRGLLKFCHGVKRENGETHRGLVAIILHFDQLTNLHSVHICKQCDFLNDHQSITTL